MDELMEMRRQLAALKESLDKSQIVNNRLLKELMTRKASFLNRVVMWEMIALPFVMLIMIANCVFYNATLWIAWCFLIIAVIDIAFDVKTIRIPPKDLNELPLIELRRKILRQKHLRKIQTIIAASVCLLWVIWAYVEWFKPMNYIEAIKSGEPVAWIIIAALALLLVVAIIVVVVIAKELDKVSDSMIAEIDEKEENDNV